jgi:hypothetical protein
VLRRIFGSKREEMAGGWRRLHNKELHNLYAPSNIIRVINSRRMRGAGLVARMGEIRHAYKIFVGKPEGERPLIRPRSRWEDNIIVVLRDLGWKVWTECIWLRIETSCVLL